ncbi:GNAT family N-acetyltransferase [Actinoplanes sp. NEAU-A12]|uniref:GNAT family N-acetyltransferase n=1 Tax=Actinoplanes sandaracinus TaxID=3045177 RepID=A0ABT6WVY3_9ACTN|nr:GNAT family N-acetyltransferase [Actinoplanes sandaracinus]MDI6103874.1 GNAT family N-acetyltransferase [Actinoplanes sandaracinus]
MTADFSIRPARPTDAAAVVALRAAVYPYLVRGEASTRRMLASPPPGEDRIFLAAERGGEVVGSASAFRQPRSADPGFGQVSLHVHPDHRGRGVGVALLAEATAHLRAVGVRRAGAWAVPEAVGFARGHGFEPSRELRYSALDLTGFTGVPDPGPGIRLAGIREVDERALYDADVAAATDEPGDVPSQPTPYPTWRYEIWDEPGLDRDASTVALDGSAVVAFSLVLRDGDRVWSDMTATAPAYRGRGLARLVKTAALVRAAAGGVRTAYTSNDESNAPMLAVNARLGYRPVATQLSCVAEL